MVVSSVINMDLVDGMPILGNNKLFFRVKDAEEYFRICVLELKPDISEEEMEDSLGNGIFEDIKSGSVVTINEKNIFGE